MARTYFTTRTGRSSEVDSRHDVIRFDGEILDTDRGLALSGVDVARLDDNGRLVDVRGPPVRIPANRRLVESK